MLLINCAACAAPLANDAPRCVRCRTRYCNKTCQHDHWRRGHKQICKKIHRGGNAEQYHADKKYKEAVAEAVEACVADTKGLKCYICLEAVHSRTGEGLVRGCACGDRDGVKSSELGVAHVSCLARQAKELVAEAYAPWLLGNLDDNQWHRWYVCGLCEVSYHGVVRCALGWACWKTYLDRPESDQLHAFGLNQLGNGLFAVSRHEECLEVIKARLHLPLHPHQILVTKGNLADCYRELGRENEAISLSQEVHDGIVSIFGRSHTQTMDSAINLAVALNQFGRRAESKRLLNEHITIARQRGPNDKTVLTLRAVLAETIIHDDDPTEAVTIFEDVDRRMRRVLGPAHPQSQSVRRGLEEARAKLLAFHDAADGA